MYKDKPKYSSTKVQLEEPMSLLNSQSMDKRLMRVARVTQKQKHHWKSYWKHGDFPIAV